MAMHIEALNVRHMDMKFEIEAIQVPFNGDSIKLIKANWLDEEATTFLVRLNETGELAEVSFEHDEGIRILEELDLAGWWLNSEGAILSESWLFLVNSGGWFDFESTRDDFYKKHETSDTKEYLIAGYQECVSILSSSKPKVRRVIAT
jgi:hypothetical protein